MICVVIVLMGIILCLATKIWNDSVYSTRQERIRFKVLSYYIENFSKYKKNIFSDVILDYCSDHHKNIRQTVSAFDLEFIQQPVHVINHLL